MKSTAGNFIKDSYNRIEKRYRICFYSGLICGLMAHIYALTNHLYNYDELWHTPTGFGTGVEVGRWTLSVTVWLQKLLFDDCFTIPFVNGFTTIILYTLTACFAVAVFNINDDFYAGVTGALMTTFPALVCRMFYMFTTHYYAIGIALTAAGIWILVRQKEDGSKTAKAAGIIVSAAFVIYGMAIYQANFVTAVCLLVGFLLVDFIRNDPELKESVRRCVFYVIYLGACMALFLIGSKLALAITGKEMETYENLDSMGKISPDQLIKGLIGCYKTFLRLPFKDVYSMNPNVIVRIAFFVSFLVFLFTFIKIWQTRKMTHLKLLITAIMAVLPVAVNLIIIMAVSSGTMYSIMVYEIVYVLVIPMACLTALSDTVLYPDPGKTTENSHKTGNEKTGPAPDGRGLMKAADIVTSIALTAAVITYIWFANGNYLAMEYTNIHDNAYFTVLMTQIKSVEGYTDDMPVALIGAPSGDSTHRRQAMIDETFNIAGKASTNIGEYSYWNIMTRVIGFDPVVRNSDEDEEYFYNHPEVAAMPKYPDDGSIKVIDDTIVVKFQDPEDIGK
ncbi:MAG: glucosyltransferase domain-containing protein [Lachnospiraceae bacterium]|nr:glucosyltransferase domain-containing protein [Lachnospiraceae bacterium]